jgi:DNA polymerase
MQSRAEILEKVYDYCAQDIRTELALHKRIRGLGSSERRVWLLDQKINERGVRLDMAFVSAAQVVCDRASEPLRNNFRKLTGLQKVMSPMFKDWLIYNGVQFPKDKDGNLDTSLDKEHIKKLFPEGTDEEEADDTLADTDEDYEEEAKIVLPKVCREPLQIRRILGSASIKKLAAMPLCCASDGRAHGLLQYHGAGPGRWSGRLLQPHNFPRPSLKISKGFDGNGKEIFEGHDPEQLVAAILTRDAEYVRACFGEPIEAVASGLRHTLVAAPGYTFEVGDFSTIEARIVLALAGAHSALAVITDKDRDVYCEMAANIFGCPAPRGKAEIKAFKEAELEKRQTGKNTVLGCGFQMGAKKFRSRYAQDKPLEFAQRCIAAYRNDFAPEVPKLWEALGQAATKTVWDRHSHEAYGIVYRMEDGFLTAHLPSDRKLWYYDPQPVRKAMPWDATDIRPAFEYSAWKMGQWKRISGYGGLCTENVVQGLARDLLVNGMFNSEADGHKVVLTVHDEMICEVSEREASEKLIAQYMEDVPQWAKQLGIPVNTECWVGARYRK